MALPAALLLALPACLCLLPPAGARQPLCTLTGPVDLSHTLNSEAKGASRQFSPGGVRFVQYGDISYANNDFCTGEHTGTHLDAPFHFNNDSWTVDQIPVERFVANGVFLNVSEEAAGDPSFQLQPEHIDRWIQLHGEFPHNAVLLISFGWAQRYHNRTLYLGTDSEDYADFRFPGLSAAAAERLAQIPQLVAVGSDTTSIDVAPHLHAHVILAARNIYNLENVNLDQPCLPARAFRLLSPPLKIGGGTGSPVRPLVLPGTAPLTPLPDEEWFP